MTLTKVSGFDNEWSRQHKYAKCDADARPCKDLIAVSSSREMATISGRVDNSATPMVWRMEPSMRK